MVKNGKIFRGLFLIPLFFSCALVLSDGDSSKSSVKVSFVQNTSEASGSRNLGVPTSDASRILVSDNASATLTVEPTLGSTLVFPFDSFLDPLTLEMVFSLEVQLVAGTYTFTVRTYDASNNLMTLGSEVRAVEKDVDTILNITLLPPDSLEAGESLSLSPLQVRYIRLTHPKAGWINLKGEATFWECQADGSYSGLGDNDSLDLYFNAGETKTIRISKNSSASSISFIEQHWAFVANLTTTGAYPTVTSPAGWEFMTSLDNAIYFATPNNTTQDPVFLSYDVLSSTKTNRTHTGSDLAAAGYDSNLVGVNGRVYYIANNANVYNPGTDSWSVLSYPDPRGESGLTTLGNKIYYFGSRNIDDTFSIFDTTTSTWTLSSGFPSHATDWSAVAAHNNLLYVFGGAETGVEQKLSRYDPLANTWTALTDIPYSGGIGASQAFTLQDKILLPAGSEIYLYDPVLGTWLDPIPNNLSTDLFAVIGNDLYAIAWSSEDVGYNLYRFLP